MISTALYMPAPFPETTAFPPQLRILVTSGAISTTGHAGTRRESMGLSELRERSGLTLRQLDLLTRVDYTRLWVCGNHDDEARNMYLGTAVRLAHALHCNVLDLYPDEHVWRGVCPLASLD